MYSTTLSDKCGVLLVDANQIIYKEIRKAIAEGKSVLILGKKKISRSRRPTKG